MTGICWHCVIVWKEFCCPIVLFRSKKLLLRNLEIPAFAAAVHGEEREEAMWPMRKKLMQGEERICAREMGPRGRVKTKVVVSPEQLSPSCGQ